MNKSEIIAAIERTAPLSIAAAWDKSGIQVPCKREDIAHIAVCLDPTPCSVRTALDGGADMILSHHPLMLEPRFFDRDDAVFETMRMLVQADVMLYAAHTSLDANVRGPAAWFSEAVGILDPCVLERTGEMTAPDGTTYECGFGQCGMLNWFMSAEEILRLTNSGCPRMAGGRIQDLGPIMRLAVCPGSGGSLVHAAAQAGAQLLVTGDMKYHSALELPIPVLDVGHFCLEETMMRRFARLLDDMLDGPKVTFTAASDPFSNPYDK